MAAQYFAQLDKLRAMVDRRAPNGEDLSADAVVQMAAQLGFVLRDKEKTLREIDTNGDGAISPIEFEAWVKRQMIQAAKEQKEGAGTSAGRSTSSPSSPGAAAVPSSGAARRRSESAPPLSGGCCTSTRGLRARDVRGAHDDFGAARPRRGGGGGGPPPLRGGCCTSTRGLRDSDVRGAHDDFVGMDATQMTAEERRTGGGAALRRRQAVEAAGAAARLQNAAEAARLSPASPQSSPRAALPWRPPTSPTGTGTGTGARYSAAAAETAAAGSQEGTEALLPLPEQAKEQAQEKGQTQEELPWRRRRAYNWEGAWKEDKERQSGMTETFEALEYPWHIRQIMKASPGPSWLISAQVTIQFSDSLFVCVMPFCTKNWTFPKTGSGQR
jgi:hypothetical protein